MRKNRLFKEVDLEMISIFFMLCGVWVYVGPRQNSLVYLTTTTTTTTYIHTLYYLILIMNFTS